MLTKKHESIIVQKMGGNRQSRHHNGTGHLLEGSAWLRTAVQHHQKKHRGVSGFESFTIEPCLIDVHCIQHFRVNVCFRDSKGKAKQVFWMVKYSERSSLLCHELRVYTEVLADVSKFLSNKKNQRAKFLLNVPDFIFHDRLSQQGGGGKNLRCHIITENVKETKRCTALQPRTVASGLNLGEFKVRFLLILFVSALLVFKKTLS